MALSNAERQAAFKAKQKAERERYAEADRVGRVLANDEAAKIAAYRAQHGREPESAQELAARVARAQAHWRWRLDNGLPVSVWS